MTPWRLLIGEVMKNRRQVAVADPWNYRTRGLLVGEIMKKSKGQVAVVDPWNYRTHGLLVGEIMKATPTCGH